MSSVNKVTLLGRLGKDPEVRHFENGSVVAKTTIATSETYTNKEGQKIENTEWHNVVFWRGLAGVVEKYLKKGDQVFIEGRIKYRSWDDADGNKRYATDIEAQNMVMLGSAKGNSNSNTNRPPEDVYAAEAQKKATVSNNVNNAAAPIAAVKTNTVATNTAVKKDDDGVSFDDDLPF